MSDRFVGVDGCRAGWFASWLEAGQLQGLIYPRLVDLYREHSDAERILIDIPIGLLPDTDRQIESVVRALLGPRRSSVFPVPCFDAAYSKDYPAANQSNRLRLAKGLSKQAWFICDKIREANDLLTTDTKARTVIGESHPELCFTRFAGKPCEHPKKSTAGSIERLEILNMCLPGAEEFLAVQLERYKRSELLADDCVDALVLTAAAFNAVELETEFQQQGVGKIDIRMWVPA